MKVTKPNLEELRKRDWPSSLKVPPPPDDYDESCYVRDAEVLTIPFERNDTTGAFYGECAITALIIVDNNKLIGATSGKNAHIFSYDPLKTPEFLKDIGIVEKQCRIKTLVKTSGGCIYGGTWPYDESLAEGCIFSVRDNRIEKVMPSIGGEGICYLLYDSSEDMLYGLTAKSGILFSIRLDSKNAEVIGKVDEQNLFSKVLCFDNQKNIWGAGRWGKIFKYSRKDKRIIYGNLQVPAMPGRSMYTEIQSMVFNPYDGWIYAGEKADGVLFRFNPETEKLICLGKPTAQPEIRGLVVGKNRKIYGIAGRHNGMCHLFTYDPVSSELRDLGILFCKDKRWTGYEFDSMVIDDAGKIYLGEAEFISHLFIVSL